MTWLYDYPDDVILLIFMGITLVLAFSLVQVIDNLHQVDALASKEAAYINNLDRLLTRYGTPEVTVIRGTLLAFSKSRVEEDWPSLVNGESGVKPDALGKAIHANQTRAY